jgi:hypothetical protein
MLALLSLACQFGGPAAIPAPPPDAAAASSPQPDGPGPTDEDVAEPVDVAAEASAEVPVEAPAQEIGEAAACVPTFTSAVCDPVCNTGCPTLSRCNIGDKPATGVCMGIWIGGVGSACLRTASTDPCAPRLTCVAGQCLRLCYQDRDCQGGCCNIQVETGGQASGYQGCGPCGL